MKLVSESLNFERGKDPKETMEIGKRGLIKKWLVEHGINNWIINEDFSINVFPDLKNEIDIQGMEIE